MTLLTYIDKKGKERPAVDKNGKLTPSAKLYFEKQKLSPNGYHINEADKLVKEKPFDSFIASDIRKMSRKEFIENFGWMGFKTKVSLFKYVKEKNIKTLPVLLQEKGKDYYNQQASIITKNFPILVKKHKLKSLIKYTTKSASSFRNYNVVYELKDGKEYKSTESFWRVYSPRLFSVLWGYGFPQRVLVYVQVRSLNNEGDTKVENLSLGSHRIYSIEDAQKVVKDMGHTLDSLVEFDASDYELGFMKSVLEGKDGGSDWRTDAILSLSVHINRMPSLAGGRAFGPLPDWIKMKHAVVNPQNKDNHCFRWCYMMFDLPTPVNRNYDIKHYKKHWSEYDHLFDEDDFPLERKNYPKYERLLGVNLVVYHLDLNKRTPKILPLYPNKPHDNQDKRTFYLMLICRGDQQHYVWVKNNDKLFPNTYQHKMKFCYVCLSHYKPEKFDGHFCSGSSTLVRLPSVPIEDRFKGLHKCVEHPFLCVADAETLQYYNVAQKEGCKTINISCHMPCSFKYVILKYGERWLEREYVGENAMRVFLDWIQEDYEKVYQELCQNEPMTHIDWTDYNMTKNCRLCGVEMFDMSPKIKIPKAQVDDMIRCELDGELPEKYPTHITEKFKDYLPTKPPKDLQNTVKCKDHDHMTGKYRQALCLSCNRQFQKRKYLPIFFHNLRGYDGHLIMQVLQQKDMVFQGVPLNREKMTVFSLRGKDFYDKREICFRDSASFLPASLDSIVGTLYACCDPYDPDWYKDDFKTVKSYIDGLTPDIALRGKMFRLLRQKTMLPYECMTNLSWFDQTEIPPIEEFFSRIHYQKESFDQLTDRERQGLEKKYKLFVEIRQTFGCRTNKHSHDIYLNMDVYMLCDVLLNYRKINIQTHGLDPVHYMTGPQLFYDGMLKSYGQGIPLLTESQKDIYHMFEQSIVGGISLIRQRYALANNPYMPSKENAIDKYYFDPTLPISYIIYVDMNSLYPTALCEKLPDGQLFEELDDITNLSLDEVCHIVFSDLEGEYGYLCEIDCHVPDELHDLFNDLPPFPENCKITGSDMGRVQEGMMNVLGLDKHTYETYKLTPRLEPKKSHIIHSKFLKLFVDLGCKIDKFHRVIRFSQSVMFKDFVDGCVSRRQKSKTDFEKDYHKASMNMPIGKTVENKRKRCDIKIANSEKLNEKYCHSPRQVWWKIINEECNIYHLIHEEIVLDRPIFIGWAVYQLSKYLMYDIYYNKFKSKWGNNMKLLMTDTDSFQIQVFTQDVYKDLMEIHGEHNLMDWSNYDDSHPVFEGIDNVKQFKNTNKKLCGFLKDEMGGSPIYEFAGLKPKSYSDKFMPSEEDDEEEDCGVNGEMCRGKGVKKRIVQNTSHQEYVDLVKFMDKVPSICDIKKEDIEREADIYLFKSEVQQIYTQKIRKTTMSAFCDKGVIMDNGIDVLAHGHYKLKEMREGERPWIKDF